MTKEKEAKKPIKKNQTAAKAKPGATW